MSGKIKLNGETSGSVTLQAPNSGSDVILNLPGVTDTLLREGGGKILQIVRATDSTDRTTSSTSYVDVTGMSVTITPEKSDSALILAAIFSGQSFSSTGGNARARFRISDSSGNPLIGGENHRFEITAVGVTSSLQITTAQSIFAYATPATTSAVTYKMQFRAESGGLVISVLNSTFATGQMYAIEVSA